MTSDELKKLFEHYAEDAQFQNWSKGEESPGMRFVYACEHGMIWKFTPKAWISVPPSSFVEIGTAG
jgi:hypothetical protein